VLLSGGLVLDRPAQALAPARRPEVVERGVASDPEQPRGGRRVAGLETAVRLVCVHEHLGRDVLGVGLRADLRSHVGVDPAQELPVEVFERWPVDHGRFMLRQRPQPWGCNAYAVTQLRSAAPTSFGRLLKMASGWV